MRLAGESWKIKQQNGETLSPKKKHSQDKGFETTVPLPEISLPPPVYQVFSEGFLHVCAEVLPSLLCY